MQSLLSLKEPLFYLAVGFFGMFVSAWLFDRASLRYPQEAPDSGSKPQSLPLHKILLRQIGSVVLLLIVLALLYKTSLIVADLLLFAACVAFALVSYRVRLKPLLASGIQQAHFMLLISMLCLWVLPLAWFVHLHLARSYGAL